MRWRSRWPSRAACRDHGDELDRSSVSSTSTPTTAARLDRMIFHLSTLAVLLLVVWAFHRYQLVSDHLVPFLCRRGLLGQYTRLPTSFDDQASAGVRP
jgi:hypothetical protein